MRRRGTTRIVALQGETIEISPYTMGTTRHIMIEIEDSECLVIAHLDPDRAQRLIDAMIAVMRKP